MGDMMFSMLKAILHRFSACHGYRQASALSFNTLFAIVPLLVVIFGVLTLVPGFTRVRVILEGFIYQNFVASSGLAVEQYLQQFVKHAWHLSKINLVFFGVTAVLLVCTIENSFNGIWRVPSRHLLKSFFIYLGVLMAAPLLVGSSFLLTSDLLHLIGVSGWFHSIQLPFSLLAVTRVLLSAAMFTTLYKLLPNAHVSIRAAFIGGLFAALLFECSKFGFGLYFKYFISYQLLYGALSVIPLFLLWIYVCWLLAILGAVVVHELDHVSVQRDEKA